MLLKVDLHAHSIFSQCGVHTVVEMLTHAKKLGLKALAITDHGTALKDCRLNSPFFLRLTNPVPGIKLLKGAELNVINDKGETDCPKRYLPFMDIVLLGLHHNLEKDMGETKYTSMLINAINKNDYIDVITHPNNPDYPVDVEKLVKICTEKSIAIEINNSKYQQGKISEESMFNLLLLCKNHSCQIVVNSDAHVLSEIGNVKSVMSLIKKMKFPFELFINRDLKTTLSFIEKRRINKKN